MRGGGNCSSARGLGNPRYSRLGSLRYLCLACRSHSSFGDRVQLPDARPMLEVEASHEPPTPPTGLGVRQPSGAGEGVGGRKRQRAGALQDATALHRPPMRSVVQGIKARNGVRGIPALARSPSEGQKESASCARRLSCGLLSYTRNPKSESPKPESRPKSEGRNGLGRSDGERA